MAASSTEIVEREIWIFRAERESVYEVRLTHGTGPVQWRVVAWVGDNQADTVISRPAEAECIAWRAAKIEEEVADLRRLLESIDCEPQFRISGDWEHRQFSLTEMLEVNYHDDEFVAWARSAQVGETWEAMHQESVKRLA